MSNIKDFQVNYRLNVQAADAVTQLKNFTSAVSGLAAVDNTLTKAASSLKTMSSSLKSVFGANGNKKYTLKIDTKTAEANIDRLMSKLSSLEDRMKGMSMGFGGMGHGSGAAMNRNIQRNMDAYARETKKAAQKAYSKYGVTPFGMGAYTGSAPKGIGGWGYPSGYAPRGKNRDAWKSGAQTVPFQTVFGGGSTPPPSSRGGGVGGRGGNRAREAAMNRLHYSHMPSWRNLPFANMVGSYFMYGAVRSELSDAIEFTHTVDAAKEVLKKTDGDLATFTERFSAMMGHVRKIGVDTRFTMVDMAKATQFMAQAGFSTDQITQAITPISNLALIADAPIQDIADNMTGVLAGYRIDTGSANALADQMAATYTRSKTTIQEMSEAFKMSAGFLQMAGVDVSEAIAAFGVLGNANLRGTMAGTSVRSMMTFLAKPSRGAKQTLSKLGVSITENVEVFGETINKLRPLADIFADLKKSGATLEDLSSIFGKIGGTGAMILANRYEELRELTNTNLNSHGMAAYLGKKKQETTSGLWEQVTSQWSESFTQVFESIEPRIQAALKGLTERLASPEFTEGLRTLGESMLTVFDIASKFGVWIVKQWSWIEPLLISGATAKAAMGLFGYLSNIFILFRSTAAVNAVGAVTQGVNSMATGLSSAIRTSGGLTGAIASVGGLGSAWLVAAGAVSAFLGVAAVAAVDFYKFEQKKSAFLEENRKLSEFNFPSLEAMKIAFGEVEQAALKAKSAKDALVEDKTLEERHPNAVGATSILDKWTNSFISFMAPIGLMDSNGELQLKERVSNLRNQAAKLKSSGKHKEAEELLKKAKTEEEDFKLAMNGGARSNYNLDVSAKASQQALQDRQAFTEESFAILAKNPNSEGAAKSIDVLRKKLTVPESQIDSTIHYFGNNGQYGYVKGLMESKHMVERSTKAYHDTMNNMSADSSTYTSLRAVGQALSNTKDAISLMFPNGTDNITRMVADAGYTNVGGKWVHQPLGKNATISEKIDRDEAQKSVSNYIYNLVSGYSKAYHGHGSLVTELLKNTGLVPEGLLKNKTESIIDTNAPSSYTNTDWGAAGASGGAKGLASAGGNYGGAGRMNSVAPKQVNVTIENLMSIETIELMGTDAGKTAEMQNLKETVTQLLIEVVHDFDSSWHG